LEYPFFVFYALVVFMCTHMHVVSRLFVSVSYFWFESCQYSCRFCTIFANSLSLQVSSGRAKEIAICGCCMELPDKVILRFLRLAVETLPMSACIGRSRGLRRWDGIGFFPFFTHLCGCAIYAVHRKGASRVRSNTGCRSKTLGAWEVY
jgi:hypothetical protein